MPTALVASAAADVMLPPTFVLDFLYLGFPVAIAAGAAIVAGAIAVYRRARRSGRGWALSTFLAALLVAGSNLACYVIWASFLRESPSARHFRETPPVATAAARDAGPP